MGLSYETQFGQAKCSIENKTKKSLLNINNIEGLEDELFRKLEVDDVSEVAISGDYNHLKNIPDEFSPKPHTHIIQEVEALEEVLSEKLDAKVTSEDGVETSIQRRSDDLGIRIVVGREEDVTGAVTLLENEVSTDVVDEEGNERGVWLDDYGVTLFSESKDGDVFTNVSSRDDVAQFGVWKSTDYDNALAVSQIGKDFYRVGLFDDEGDYYKGLGIHSTYSAFDRRNPDDDWLELYMDDSEIGLRYGEENNISLTKDEARIQATMVKIDNPTTTTPEIFANGEATENSLVPKSYVDEKVGSKVGVVENSNPLTGLWTGSQTDYDSITSKDEGILYFITNS